jgi:hypothetical protein
VADRDRTIERLSETLGRHRTYLIGGSNPHAVFRDRSTGLDLSVGNLRPGASLLEVLQPMDDKSGSGLPNRRPLMQDPWRPLTFLATLAGITS